VSWVIVDSREDSWSDCVMSSIGGHSWGSNVMSETSVSESRVPEGRVSETVVGDGVGSSVGDWAGHSSLVSQGRTVGQGRVSVSSDGESSNNSSSFSSGTGLSLSDGSKVLGLGGSNFGCVLNWSWDSSNMEGSSNWANWEGIASNTETIDGISDVTGLDDLAIGVNV